MVLSPPFLPRPPRWIELGAISLMRTPESCANPSMTSQKVSISSSSGRKATSLSLISRFAMTRYSWAGRSAIS